MINNKTKLNHYNILNSIRTEYLKIKEPFSIPSNINITYKEIKLKYLTGKNYFVEFSSTGQSRDQPKDKSRKSRSKSPKSKKPTRSPGNSERSPRNSERSPAQKSERKFTAEETAAYLARKARREESPGLVNRKFTAEETAAYLARKARREESPRPESNHGSKTGSGKPSSIKKNSLKKKTILVFS